jgi:hypothetical protein
MEEPTRKVPKDIITIMLDAELRAKLDAVSAALQPGRRLKIRPGDVYRHVFEVGLDTILGSQGD